MPDLEKDQELVLKFGGTASAGFMVIAISTSAWEIARKKAEEEGTKPSDIVSRALVAYCS
jgi:hypothetical protein